MDRKLSMLVTAEETLQDLHADFDRLSRDEAKRPWVLYCPLCEKGMELNIVVSSDKKSVPIRVKIPFGNFFFIRGDVVYDGCFGSEKNCRFYYVFNHKPYSGQKLCYFFSIP